MRPWFKKKRFILALILAALVLMGQLLGDNNDRAPTAGVPAGSETSRGADTREKRTNKPADSLQARIGDTVPAGEWEFKVTKFQCGHDAVGNSYLKKKAQGQFCFLNINATNNGDDEGLLDERSQKLLDADGREYSSDSEASLYEDPDSRLFLEGVNPGNTARGLIVFDVPKKARLTEVSLRGGFFDDSASVDLK
jgi:hypothetical protein